ncbi:MAG: hypothetical protein ACYDCK_00060 [Thermoplasmatota archaeon]
MLAPGSRSRRAFFVIVALVIAPAIIGVCTTSSLPVPSAPSPVTPHGAPSAHASPRGPVGDVGLFFAPRASSAGHVPSHRAGAPPATSATTRAQPPPRRDPLEPASTAHGSVNGGSPDPATSPTSDPSSGSTSSGAPVARGADATSAGNDTTPTPPPVAPTGADASGAAAADPPDDAAGAPTGAPSSAPVPTESAPPALAASPEPSPPPAVPASPSSAWLLRVCLGAWFCVTL